MADTDASGLVYHANYLAYAERARTEMLREVGITQQALLEAGNGFWAVADAIVRFRRPARLDDAIVVRSRPVDVGAATCRIEQRIERDGELLAEVTVTAAYLSMDGRPKRQPPEWRTRFQAIADAAAGAW